MPNNPEKHSPYFNLTDALKEKHCPICFLARKAVTRYLDNLLYESVNDPGLRETLRKAHGFCEKHFWQLIEFNDGLGISILAKDLLETMEKEWRENPKKLERSENVMALCPACDIWNQNEENYIGLLVENLGEIEFRSAYRKSFGLCVFHFREAYLGIQSESRRKEFLTHQSEKMKMLVTELEEFMRKFDYRHAHEKFGEERDVWIRAVELLKGRSDLLNEKHK